MRLLRRTLCGMSVLFALGCGTPDPAPEPAPEPAAGPAAEPVVESSAACAPVGQIQFICDLISPEDLAVIPDSEWIIASGNQEGGKLHLVNVRDKSTLVLYPTSQPREQLDAATYPACPGPMDPAEGAEFRAHGLYLKPGEGGVHTVYLVHHGFRESVEVFNVDANQTPPTLTWIGCAVAPEALTFNSVVALPDGGLAATSFRTAGMTESFDEILEGKTSGSVWEWHTDQGWTEVPESLEGGPNGLEISADGQWFYISGWGSQRFVRLSRGRTPVEKDAVDLHFRPDNIRLQTDGTVLAAGADGFDTPEETLHVARIDPSTMTFERIIDRPVIEKFAACTTATQIGDEIWMGTNRGEKIGYFPVP